MNNQEYWQKRAISDALENWKRTGVAERELDKLFSRVMKDIAKELSAFYSNYATDDLFTYQAINEKLTQHEQLLQADSINDLVESLTATTDNPIVEAELAKINSLPSVSRLDDLLKRIAIQTVKLSEESEHIVKGNLSDVYEESYYKNLYNLAIGTGQSATFSVLPTEAIIAAISQPLHGTYFSQAIWDNREVLTKKLRTVLTDGLTKGYSNQKMSKLLADEMNKGYKASLRVIRTETSKVMSEGSRTSYEKFGVEKYQIIATLDNRTSEICQKQDLKVYRMDQFEIGSTASPFHPNCRSSNCPYIEDLETTRLARDEQGQTYEVDGNMSYQEWKKKFVK